MKFRQVNQHSCSAAAISGPTEAAVTDPSARRALPLLTRHNEISQVRPTHTVAPSDVRTIFPGAHRVQQRVSDLLSVPVTETRAAELTPHSNALRVTAVGFGVGCFLAALVASCALKIEKKVNLWPKDWDKENHFSITEGGRGYPQWSCCRLSPAHCCRCSAAPTQSLHPQAALHEGWYRWRSGDGAVNR